MRGSIPGRIAASTQSGMPSVPGKIPGGMTSCPTPVRQQAGVVLFEILRLYQGIYLYTLLEPTTQKKQTKTMVCLYQVKLRFCSYQVKSTILFIPGGGVPLLTPASVGRRALGRPIDARRAIATAFA